MAPTYVSFFYKNKSGQDITDYPNKQSISTTYLYCDKACLAKHIIGQKTAISYALDSIQADHSIETTLTLNGIDGAFTVKYFRKDLEDIEGDILSKSGAFKGFKNFTRHYIADDLTHHKREIRLHFSPPLQNI